MHVPGHNPYLTTTGEEAFDMNAIINYLSGAEFWESGPHSGYSGEYSPYTSTFNVNLPSYGYQGISPEIMQALGNVFTVGEDGFNPQIFGEDFISSQIEEQMQDISQEDWVNLLPEDYMYTQEQWDEATPLGWSTSENIPGVSPSLGEIADWDYGDMESALGVTNVFKADSIANTLSQLAGFTGAGAIRPGEVKELTPEMIEETTFGYYTPYEEAQRAELVEDLASARTGVSTGGFAGSGSRQSGLSGAERLYRGGYEDILAGILKARGAATTDVLDTIYGWQELMDTP